MKEKVKGFVAGVASCVLAFSLVGGALAASQTISISPISVLVNGEKFAPKDVNGDDVLVFAYNGTTYAPLRALAESYGLVVGYDQASNMATVDKPASSSLTLGIGTYSVGADIAAGKYDVVAVSGSGNFQGDVASCQFGSLNEILSADGSYGHSSTYSNLVLAAGDTLYIKGNLTVQLTKK
jgi:hypothetical protein